MYPRSISNPMSLRHAVGEEEPSLNFSLRSLVSTMQGGGTAASAPSTSVGKRGPGASWNGGGNGAVGAPSNRLFMFHRNVLPPASGGAASISANVPTHHGPAISEVLAARQNTALKSQLCELASRADKDILAATRENERLRKSLATERARAEHNESTLRAKISSLRSDNLASTQGLEREVDAVMQSNQLLRQQLAEQARSIPASEVASGDRDLIASLRQQITKYNQELSDARDMICALKERPPTPPVHLSPPTPPAPPAPPTPPSPSRTPGRFGPPAFHADDIAVRPSPIGATLHAATKQKLDALFSDTREHRAERRLPMHFHDKVGSVFDEVSSGCAEGKPKQGMLTALVRDFTRHMLSSSADAQDYIKRRREAAATDATA